MNFLPQSAYPLPQLKKKHFSKLVKIGSLYNSPSPSVTPQPSTHSHSHGSWMRCLIPGEKLMGVGFESPKGIDRPTAPPPPPLENSSFIEYFVLAVSILFIFFLWGGGNILNTIHDSHENSRNFVFHTWSKPFLSEQQKIEMHYFGTK